MLPFILRFYDVAISGRVLISELTDMLYFDVTGFMTAEVLELQQKFEEDKKRIAKMKAARKFQPFWSSWLLFYLWDHTILIGTPSGNQNQAKSRVLSDACEQVCSELFQSAQFDVFWSVLMSSMFPASYALCIGNIGDFW